MNTTGYRYGTIFGALAVVLLFIVVVLGWLGWLTMLFFSQLRHAGLIHVGVGYWDSVRIMVPAVAVATIHVGAFHARPR